MGQSTLRSQQLGHGTGSKRDSVTHAVVNKLPILDIRAVPILAQFHAKGVDNIQIVWAKILCEWLVLLLQCGMK
jgi:hypothetical protein